MTRKTTTVMLEETGCLAGSEHTVEKALRDVPGVFRAYVNPATEAAYVEYDGDRCAEKDLEAAIESVGVHALHPTSARGPISFPTLSRRIAMPNTHAVSSSRTWWAFAGFIAIAGFLLFTEHRAHLFGALPFLFLLACPFLHMFGHSGHGGHGGQSEDESHNDERGRSAPAHHHAAQDEPPVGDRGRNTW